MSCSYQHYPGCCCVAHRLKGERQKLGGHPENPGERQWWLRAEPQLWGSKWHQWKGWVARAQGKEESEGNPFGPEHWEQ